MHAKMRKDFHIFTFPPITDFYIKKGTEFRVAAAAKKNHYMTS